jgi:ABC-type branched-subunit amino acid transport system permease subunit
MPVPPSNPQDTHTALAVLISIAACLCVAYWRTALRLILIIVIATTVYGIVVGMHGVTSLMAPHQQ